MAVSSAGAGELALSGLVAVVTGAAGGFGRATAERLLREGARVALWDIDADRVAVAARELDPSGAAALAIGVDVGDSAAVDRAAARTREALGPIGALVNNAGVVDAARPWEVSDASWERHFRVNAHGAFYCVRACLPDMRERRYGKIVNIGSLAAQQGRPTTNPAYPASKGAVLGLTVSLARHLGEFGICVNAINPGFIKTEIHDQFTRGRAHAADGGHPAAPPRRARRARPPGGHRGGGLLSRLAGLGLRDRRVPERQRRHEDGFMSSSFRVSVDIGGTFTDCTVVAPDGAVTIGKAPSTPDDFSRGLHRRGRGRGAGARHGARRAARAARAACRTGRPSASTPSSAARARASG